MRARVHLHLLDPIPAIVVAKVTDGLRARGLDTEVHGDSREKGGEAVPAHRFLGDLAGDTRRHGARPQVFITSRPLYGNGADTVFGHADRARESAIVSLPKQPGESRFHGAVATRVLKMVVHELGRLSGREPCDDRRCVMSHAESTAALDAQKSSLCIRCSGT